MNAILVPFLGFAFAVAPAIRGWYPSKRADLIAGVISLAVGVLGVVLSEDTVVQVGFPLIGVVYALWCARSYAQREQQKSTRPRPPRG